MVDVVIWSVDNISNVYSLIYDTKKSRVDSTTPLLKYAVNLKVKKNV